MGRRIKGRKGKKEAVKIEKTLDLGCRELYQVDTGGAGGVSIGKLHGIGTREKQQDAFGISDVSHIEEKGLLLVLADGMGGLSGGETASMETVVACLSYFDSMEMAEEPEEYFSHMMEYANEQVKKALGSHHGDGGSTAVAVWLWEHSMFYISVGDSRLLLFREGELTQLNREHNYLTILLEKAMRGEITLDEAENLNSLADLIRNGMIVSRYEVNGTKTTGTLARNGYYVVPLFSANYAGVQNGAGVSGDVMIRRQAFELLGEYGYYKGMVPYISNQYKASAKSDGTILSDKYTGTVTSI